ncbi:hypothetical protein SH1V18_35020 [Vallitalea longa]|uniref:Aminoacyl-transfer RNA synthetases class-II family profile domain-containing protein n=1 Tax=Vallitalea longa TaxID=2936439 RepID=A0A9W6DGY9_9FIRM|nr:hypothetical protein [Vallitalea longa]GKX31022.1 hypothetical protein SH1V18_35020 [Vallitalea longa]
MFESYKFELKRTLSNIEIKSFSYLLMQQTSVHKVYVDEVNSKNVTVYYLQNKDIDEIKKEIDDFLEQYFISNKEVAIALEGNIITNDYLDYCSTCKPKNNTNISIELLKRGWIKLLRGHDMQFSGELIRLLEYFDRSYVKYMMKHYDNVKEVKYSTLIPKYYMEKLNYFQSAPKHLFYPMTLNNDTTKDFANSIQKNKGKLPNEFNNYLGTPKYVLQSAPCFKIYFSLQDQEIEDNLIYTVKGECYRNEGKKTYLLERLLNFSMREFVFLGEPNFVVENRENILKWTFEWMQELGIKGNCALANDPFFICDDARKNFEIPKNVKYEVKADIPYKNDSLSIASFDTHGNYFSKTFNFNINKSNKTWSGCMGLGIERCTWSFLQQYGLDNKQWPEIIRRELNEGY